MILLIFQVDEFWCALRVAQVQEIVAMATLVQVPGHPSLLQGFLNLRGTMLPIVRTAALFGLPVQLGLFSPIVVIRVGESSLGLAVSQVESVVTIGDGEVRPLAADHVANGYADAEIQIGNRKVVLLDGARLLLKEEQRRIAEIQSQVEQRLRALEVAAP